MIIIMKVRESIQPIKCGMQIMAQNWNAPFGAINYVQIYYFIYFSE